MEGGTASMQSAFPRLPASQTRPLRVSASHLHVSKERPTQTTRGASSIAMAGGMQLSCVFVVVTREGGAYRVRRGRVESKPF
jgi:hypothetical protein